MAQNQTSVSDIMRHPTTKQVDRISYSLDHFITVNKERLFPVRFVKHDASEKKTLRRLGKEAVVSTHLASCRSVATAFTKEYFRNPRKALMLIICDRFHPVELVTKDGVGHKLPATTFEAANAMWRLISSEEK